MSEQKVIIADPLSLRVQHLLNIYDEQLSQAKEPAAQIEAKILATKPANCVLSQQESEEFLLEYAKLLEKEIAQLCSTHSKYFWLHLHSALPVELKGEAKLFPKLYFRPWYVMLKLALLKFGANHIYGEYVIIPPSNFKRWIFSENSYKEEDHQGPAEECYFEHPEQAKPRLRVKTSASPAIIPKQLRWEDILKFYQIAHLVNVYYRNCISGLYRVRCGGQLKVSEGQFAGGIELSGMSELFALQEERMEKYHHILSFFGSISNLVEPTSSMTNCSLQRLGIIMPIRNVENIEIPFLVAGETARGVEGHVNLKTNFVPIFFTLEPFYQKAKIFNEEIARVFHASPKEIVAFLMALNYANCYRLGHSSDWRLSFYQRGYTTLFENTLEGFRQELATHYHAIYCNLFSQISQQEAFLICQKFMEWLTYKEEDFEQIKLPERMGAKLFMHIPGGLLIDYENILMILESIFYALSSEEKGGPVGKRKGRAFEEEVKKYLETNFPQFSPWLYRKKLASPLDPSIEIGEIDISFCLGPVLFIVECKAFNVSPRLAQGDPRGWQNRDEKIKKAIHVAEGLATFLKENPKGKTRNGEDYEIPIDIKFIISLVVSPFPEHIERSDRYFLNNRIPRVCTPMELVEFLTDFSISDHLTKPFVIRINRLNKLNSIRLD